MAWKGRDLNADLRLGTGIKNRKLAQVIMLSYQFVPGLRATAIEEPAQRKKEYFVKQLVFAFVLLALVAGNALDVQSRKDRSGRKAAQASGTPATTGDIWRQNIDEPANLAKVGVYVPQRPRPWDRVKEVAIGAPAPGWSLKTAEGEAVALSELRGNVVVLDFWANWCGPCRKLEPLFDQLVGEYQSKSIKFFTLSIWPDHDFNPRAYLKEHKMASTFLLADDEVANDYGIWGVPTYYVIDATGKVSYLHVLLSVNSEALGKRLRDAIDQALSKGRLAQSSFDR